jgi:hypothetical protein
VSDAASSSDRKVGWILEGTIAILLSINAYLLINNFERMDRLIASNRLDGQQMRLDIANLTTANAINGFSRSDWFVEKEKFDKELRDIQRQINDLERRRQ